MLEKDFATLLVHVGKNVDLPTACYALGYKPNEVLDWATRRERLSEIKKAEALARLNIITTLQAQAESGDVQATRELRAFLGIDGKAVQREKILEEFVQIAEKALDQSSMKKLLRALHEAEN